MTTQQSIFAAREHHQAGRFREAEALYRQALAAEPYNADALHLLGVLAYQGGRLDIAMDLIQRAIKSNPGAAPFHCNLAQVLTSAGRMQEALSAYEQALTLQPGYPEALNNRGNALLMLGRLEEAGHSFRRALEFRPDYAQAHNNLGNVLQHEGRIDEAIAGFRQAIRLLPQYAEAHNNLGNALLSKGELDQALASFQQAISLRPNDPQTLNNMGTALHEIGRYDEAIASLQKALALKPDYAAACNNLGSTLRQTGQIEPAASYFRQALVVSPNLSAAHVNLAHTLLMQGRLREGWQEFEWRLRGDQPDYLRKQPSQPRWDGSALDGKRILVRAEQGFGDTIQFARYLPMIAQRGGKVIFECHPDLVRLMRGVAGVEQAIEFGAEWPDFETFSPLLSLPAIFDTTLETIPATVPYLYADDQVASQWRSRLQTEKMKIGLAWAGRATHRNDRNRSIPSTLLAPLASISGVSFFSLQKDRTAPEGLELTDWTSELPDFTDTAALIANLDLVITVDTAVAHLAGALGKPVWVLLSFASDWRWMLDRDDSPWYPTMKLIRQTRAGDWDGPIQQVVQKLHSMVPGAS